MMKIAEMLDLYSALDTQGQERLLEEFALQGENGDMAALFLTGYLSTPVREDIMSAAAEKDWELLLAYADYCASEYGHTCAGRRKVYALCLKGRESDCAPLLNKLALLTLTGCGCVGSISRAEKLFRRGALLGSSAARENLELLEKLKVFPELFSQISPVKAVTAEKLKGVLPQQGPAGFFSGFIACRLDACHREHFTELKIS